MPTKEELERQNEELQAEIEELRSRERMEEDVWDGRLPSPKENRARVQERLEYEKAATVAIEDYSQEDTSVESQVDEDVQKELEELRKENEKLRKAQEDKDKAEDKDKTPAKKTAETPKKFS